MVLPLRKAAELLYRIHTKHCLHFKVSVSTVLWLDILQSSACHFSEIHAHVHAYSALCEILN